MQYWLLKTEPNTYSWDDLLNEKNQTTTWEGVRNYQARNFMRDQMKQGDHAVIYHSVVKPQVIMGIVEIIRAAYIDYFAFDPKHSYYDPKSNRDDPKWVMVDVKAKEAFEQPISRDILKSIPELQNMVLFKNSRLSVQPLQASEWQIICSLSPVNAI
ncbi:MAG: EVE domain-containing protein [Caldithrix sp.]|nr:EVE domain-containing protein [Caldithrix sp.]